jgi:cobaltochelatase CobN
MHWVAAQPGCLDAERELILIDQTPGEIVFLSAADTDLASAARIWSPRFGARLRIAHAAPLRQPVAADNYIATVIRHARLVVVRLLGGRAYFPHFLQGLVDLKELAERPDLLLLSGTDSFDEELAGMSDFPRAVCEHVFRYFQEGGRENLNRAGEAFNHLLARESGSMPLAVPMPLCGIYKRSARGATSHALLTFYRAWFQAEDLAVIDHLIASLERRGFSVSACYAYSLRDAGTQQTLLATAREEPPDVVVMLQSFSLANFSDGADSFMSQFGCPILQAVVAASAREDWLDRPSGLPPSEVAINVALPEIDGRVFTTVIGFKEDHQLIPEAEFTIKRLVPDPEQIQFVTEVSHRWATLRRKPNSEKRIALILSNYPNRDGRIGNGVGLDTPASTVNVLRALKQAGYDVEGAPDDGEELMRLLQHDVTNDSHHSYGKAARQSIASGEVGRFIGTLPKSTREKLLAHWPRHPDEDWPVAGLQFGNVFVGIQPPRGFSLQPQAIYHSPDLPPPPQYLAFYLWLREIFQADAAIHLGKHGNLEWLPGRSVALGPNDFPQICLGPLPNLYPFIVNNPGEGTQAKRRNSAVIIDHLTPPLTRAGLYRELEQVERLLEEHAHAVTLYPARAAELERQIEEVLTGVSWRDELPDAPSLTEAAGNYLCEIKESQIRSGLHILGQVPSGEKQIDFLLSLLRNRQDRRPGLLEALHGAPLDLQNLSSSERDALDLRARAWIERRVANEDDPHPASDDLSALRDLLDDNLLPNLNRCEREISQLLAGLDGKFIEPGPAGAPTRGRLDVLPTGRNFFALDPRVLPTPTAWACGKLIAERLMEKYRQDSGEHLRKMALVIWGTSNMRTGGDDIAQALWLWGCEPVWDAASGRVVDFNMVPAALLGRPRVDLVLRVSGLFRDAFGDVLRLLSTVPKRLAELDESEEANPIRQASRNARQDLINRGETREQALRLSTLRVFSSGPGCYGTGLLPLIDSHEWKSKQDLAEVFCKWGGHAVDTDGSSTEQIELLQSHLRQVEVVHQNQDNREHDILDSDDYFQFQGGLHATVTALRGSPPATYHGDSSQPDQPRIRPLAEELARVLRSRVLNPKWIEAMREHGYKGAFEMAATVDYLFGYGATTPYVRNDHYDEVAHALLLAPEQKAFFTRYNPVALQEATQRLLEAHERGLWTEANPSTLSALEDNLLELEGELE